MPGGARPGRFGRGDSVVVRPGGLPGSGPRSCRPRTGTGSPGRSVRFLSPGTGRPGVQKQNRFPPTGRELSRMDEETALMLEHARAALAESGAHGVDHTARVVRLCEEIGAREGAEMGVLIPAALFHDIARPLEEETGVPHEEAGARMAETFLRSIRYPEDRIAGIVHAVRAHR